MPLWSTTKQILSKPTTTFLCRLASASHYHRFPIRPVSSFWIQSPTTTTKCSFLVKTNHPSLFFGSRISHAMSSTKDNNESDKSKDDLPRIESFEIVGSTKWLRLETLMYTDIEQKTRLWDYATRTTKQSKDSANAVVIISLLKRPYAKDLDTNDPYDTLLVEQFRPPVKRNTFEFPAGLIDKGETTEHAALREFREETGYVGEACKIVPTVSALVCMSPRLCDETVHCVMVTVDLDNPYNDTKGELFQATPDEGEFIKLSKTLGRTRRTHGH